jgi:hypothetical protein
MLKVIALVGFVVLVATPCFAQAPAAAPFNLSAVLGLSGDSLQHDLLFLASCTEGTTRTYPDGNCCNAGRSEERETDKCVNGQWQFVSYTCTTFLCKF